MENTVLGIIYFVALSHGLMLFILLLNKSRNGGPGKWLAMIAAVICYKLYEGGAWLTGLYIFLHHSMGLLTGHILVIGPLIWGYAYHVTGKKRPVWYVWVLHFLPALAIWYLSSPSVFTGSEQKIAMWQSSLIPSTAPSPMPLVLLFFAMKVHLSCYLWGSWRALEKCKVATSYLRSDNTQQVLTGVQFLVVAFFALEMLWLTLFIGQQAFGFGTLNMVGNYWLLCVALTVLGIGFVGLQKPDLVFTAEEQVLLAYQPEAAAVPEVDNDNVKYLHSALPEDTSVLLSKELEHKIAAEQLYLKESLSLTDLAKATDIKAHTLSQIINQGMKTNFYKLINGYRVQHAVGLIEDVEVHWSLERIAYESGFSNRVTFSKAFKDVMDCTPSAYKKQLKQVS